MATVALGTVRNFFTTDVSGPWVNQSDVVIEFTHHVEGIDDNIITMHFPEVIDTETASPAAIAFTLPIPLPFRPESQRECPFICEDNGKFVPGVIIIKPDGMVDIERFEASNNQPSTTWSGICGFGDQVIHYQYKN